jgi:subtilisin family serine protease
VSVTVDQLIVKWLKNNRGDRMHWLVSMHADHFHDCVSRLQAHVRHIKRARCILCPLTEEEAEYLQNHPHVKRVEKNHRISLHFFKMNQPKQKMPWGVDLIEAKKAWKHTTGERVRVGVIDTGISFVHPDLMGNVVRCVDLSGNSRALPMDFNGHGTHVAGIIAAKNNKIGTIGVAPKAWLYGIKAFNSDGESTTANVVEALHWCINNRMHVINMSFGSSEPSELIHDAVKEAYRRGIIMVASAGNDGPNGGVDYPAKYPEVIGVGSIGKLGRISKYSSRGEGLDVLAPGEKIYSTWFDGGYKELDGTSMSAPHVTGTLALLKALRPSETAGSILKALGSYSLPMSFRSQKPGIIHVPFLLKNVRELVG